MPGDRDRLRGQQFGNEMPGVIRAPCRKNARYGIASGVFIQLCRNGLKKQRKPTGVINLVEIFRVKSEDIAFYRVDRLQVVRFDILSHGLRHSSDEHIKAQESHHFPMHGIAGCNLRPSKVSEQIIRIGLTDGP